MGAELIFRRGTPPGAEYTFKRALVQDAAYRNPLPDCTKVGELATKEKETCEPTMYMQ